MRKFFIVLGGLTMAFRAYGIDVYGAAPSAESIALGGIYLGRTVGPTDALASNPALLSGFDRPYLELSASGVFAGGEFHNSTTYVGRLQSKAGAFGSAGFAARIRGSRFSVGLGVLPVSVLADRWALQDPPGTGRASYGIQQEKSAFLAIQSSFGLGFQVSRRLSLGAALGVVDNLNTLETPYVFQANATLAGLKTLLNLHTRGIGYNGTFGLVAEPTHRVKLGLAYKTRTTVRSTGSAHGDAYAQFAALGLAYASSFHYNAEVDNVFPQTASASGAWQANRRVRTFLQADWLNWRRAFTQLPVHLTNGDNALLHSLLNSTSLNDSIPLRWRNQLSGKTGMEVSLGESFMLEGGYSHENSPVPLSTLTPLTAALSTDSLSSGLAYGKGQYRLQFGYQVNLPRTVSVGNSVLLAGEYSHTRTSLWLQTIALTAGYRF